jgi:hypothetical protein
MTPRTYTDKKRSDNPDEDWGLLNYKLDELSSKVSAGFGRIDAHLEKQDVRVNDLYIWRAGIETKTTGGVPSLSGKDLGKIILAVVGLATLALTILSQGIK